MDLKWCAKESTDAVIPLSAHVRSQLPVAYRLRIIQQDIEQAWLYIGFRSVALTNEVKLVFP